MEFTLLELNELIYCVGTASRYGNLVNNKVANELWHRLSEELELRCSELDKLMEAETSAVQRWG
jgi:hypothetical protein